MALKKSRTISCIYLINDFSYIGNPVICNLSWTAPRTLKARAYASQRCSSQSRLWDSYCFHYGIHRNFYIYYSIFAPICQVFFAYIFIFFNNSNPVNYRNLGQLPPELQEKQWYSRKWFCFWCFRFPAVLFSLHKKSKLLTLSSRKGKVKTAILEYRQKFCLQTVSADKEWQRQIFHILRFSFSFFHLISKTVPSKATVFSDHSIKGSFCFFFLPEGSSNW